jgi:subtilisin-like proprotein convertase family protein
MQSKTTLNRIGGYVFLAFLMLFFSFLTNLSVQAQQYVNGNLSTGATSSNGTAAPAGYEWSEVQTGNVNAGFGSSIANSLSLADDFTVPTGGGNWTVSKVTLYAYSTNYTGTASPFTDLRLQIFNTDPSVGSPAPIFGDLTTNRLSNSSATNLYRIFNATTGTTRLVWKLEANISVVLPPGNYWMEWQTGVGTGITSNFMPPSTVVGTTTQPGNNAKQHDLTANTWTAVADGTTIPDNFQDFHFRIDYATQGCTGTPNPGNTISSVSNACIGVPFTLGISTPVTGIGISFQWQSSPDNVSYTNITGATNDSYSTSLTTGSTWYRLAVTCAGSGQIGYSTPIQVTQTPPSGCYCTSTATSTADEDIFRVKIGTLDNSSTCSSLAPGFGSVQNRYSNYTSGTGAPAPGVVISGGTNPIAITIGTCGGNFTNSVAVWIDYNRNGNLESSEKVYVSTTGTQGPHTETGNAFIPASASSGVTLMRVVNVETGTPGNINPCGTYTWGETEDYLVNIRPCVPVALTTQPANQTTSCGGSATFSVAASGDNPAYVWEQRTSATAPWTFVTNGGMFSGANTNTLTITGATSAMNGYQYRAVFTGSCTATDFSATATLTVNPLTAQVSPTSATICNGTSQQLQIQNSASASVTTTVPSGTLSLIVPDADPAGVISAPIAISGIPANAVVTDISVNFNMTHTWVGDLDINLIAPNGQNLNLIGSLNNGTGSNGTDNFTNTTISSTSTTPISGAPAPRTGTFAAERRAGYGPTGNEQTASDWPAMLTQLNGDWKLAMADFFNGDEGTLTSWSITITYTSPVLADGTWSPTTALFTNATLTTPYTGGLVNTVYAAPTTSTTYTVVVQTPICTSSPLDIPITVANPIANVTQPANKEVCEKGTTTITTSAASGNPITYQWQLSTDGGVTYNNVTNGGVYSGATTGSLTITDAPVSLNGNVYRCIMSVAACNSTVTTNNATLTVHPNPVLTIAAAPFTSLYPGLQTTLSANVTASSAISNYEWIYNGAPLSGSNATQVVDIDGLGEYTLTVTDANGCVGSSSNSVVITDSLNTTLFIYPNPNKGVFQVRFYDKQNGVANPRFMNIYDSKGARVYRKAFAPSFGFGRMDVDLTGMGKGVYYIDLTDAAGLRLATERVVVF